MVEWGVRGISFPPVSTPVDHRLVLALSGTRERLSLPVKLAGYVAVTDAAFYAGMGVPAVIYGPSGGGAHAKNRPPIAVGGRSPILVESAAQVVTYPAGTVRRSPLPLRTCRCGRPWRG